MSASSLSLMMLIEYRIDSGDLVRSDDQTGIVTVVAKGAAQFVVSDLGSSVRLELTLERNGISNTYILFFLT